MSITIDDSEKAHNSTESIDRFNRSRKQGERTGRNSSRPRHQEDRQWSKSRNSQSSLFCTHCRYIGHDVSDCLSIKRKETGRRFERNTRRSDSNRSPEGNQVNVANTRSGEILTRGLDNRRSPLQCTRRTFIVVGFWCHISRNPEHRMVFELFGRNKRHNPTRQWAGMQKSQESGKFLFSYPMTIRSPYTKSGKYPH